MAPTPLVSNFKTYPVTAKTVFVQGPGLASLGDEAIERACRDVCIGGGFSVHEFASCTGITTAQVEFPHEDAAARFVECSEGELKINGRGFHVRAANSRPPIQKEYTDGTSPSDTLLLRRTADASEKEILEAFSLVIPRVRNVKVLKSFSGQHKGLAYVMFHEIHEAETALRRFKSENIRVGGRWVTAEFAQAETPEQIYDLQKRQERAEEIVKTNHAQALSGVNSDMWANYLAMFSEGGVASSDGGASPPGAKRLRVAGGEEA